MEDEVHEAAVTKSDGEPRINLIASIAARRFMRVVPKVSGLISKQTQHSIFRHNLREL